MPDLRDAVARLSNDIDWAERFGSPRQRDNQLTDIQIVLDALVDSKNAPAEARIVAALECMDESMYGDAEVPFRMRARLTGRAYSDYQSTKDYKESTT